MSDKNLDGVREPGGAGNGTGIQPGAGADNGGADVSGLKNKIDELLTETKTLKKQNQDLAAIVEAKKAEEAKAKGEYDKHLAEKESALAKKERELKQKNIAYALVQAGAHDGEWSKVALDSVSDDLSNLDEYITGLKESHSYLFGSAGQQQFQGAMKRQFDSKGKPPQGGDFYSDEQIAKMSLDQYDEAMKKGLIKR